MAVSLLLVGGGKMGGALLDGWLDGGGLDRAVVVEPQGLAQHRSRPPVERVDAPAEIPADFRPDVVVLAVKPQVMDQVAPAYRRFVRPETVFLSIAAGRTLGSLASHLGPSTAIVRAMPNTPAAVRHGITVACASPAVTEAQRALCDRLLRVVGEVAWIADEALMDAVTAVSGSGPAYVFLLVEALAAAGTAAGLPVDLAMRLARATVAGSGELVRRSPETPETLRRNVTSPGGTTEAALNVLMAPDGLPALMERAVQAAARRSRELAQ